MRLILWGTYDTGKPRLRILREGLRGLGVTVEEIHSNPWRGIEDKSQIRGIGLKLRIAWRWVSAYPKLIWHLIRVAKPDLILISYPGIPDVLFASLIGRLRRIPVAWDVFLSLYDTIVEDRHLWGAKSLRAKALKATERLALRCPEAIFMDTQAHARRIESLFSMPRGRCDAVWVGAESSVFAVQTPELKQYDVSDKSLRVLFYGQFIPLHGIPVIIEAARKLKNEPIEWTLIGRGQEAPRIRAMLDAEPLPKVNWIEWVTYEQLKQYITISDICLGIFGSSEKAASVIPNKVFQIVSAGRPLITRNSDAVRELLQHVPPCTQLIAPGDPTALADAILSFEPAKARFCHQGLQSRISEAAIGAQFVSMIKNRLMLNG